MRRLHGIFLVLLTSAAFAASRQTSFSNFSSREVYVDDLYIDGKPLGAPCGILLPGSFKTSVNVFPKRIPDEFRIEFWEGHAHSAPLIVQAFDGREVARQLKQVPRGSDAVLHIVLGVDRKFVAKLEVRAPNGDSHQGQLWPDETNPSFQAYGRLVDAANSGDQAAAKAAIGAGAPQWWADPRKMTPLEGSVRWNRREVFDLLMDKLPADYPVAAFSHAVRLAGSNGNTDILRRLLAHPSARKASKFDLQETLYLSVSSPKPIETIELLLGGLPVDINYRVRDYGHTMLIVAAEGHNVALVKWLLEHGADPALPLENGDTAITRARDPAMRAALNVTRQ